MRTLAFDGRMGASGDMLLGALVAAGADPAVLDAVEDALPVAYEVRSVTKNGIGATAVDVLLTDGAAEGDEDSTDTEDRGEREDVNIPKHGHTHGHSDGHDHDGSGHSHSSTDSHGHDHLHAEGHGHSRTYPEVLELVDSMALPASVEDDAIAIFELLGEAESSVHGTDLAETHFHEVGADDAIADVVGVCLLLDDLDVGRVVTTPLSTGGGEVGMDHGTYPIPAPAVVELAERADWSLRGGPVDAELLTPTGAAILAHFAEGVEVLPGISVASSGYGAGGYDFPDRPNVLRALVGEAGGGLRREDVTVLETHVDDTTPEVLGDLQTSLGEVGARDVTIVPTTMKKSRPGHLVKVVVKPEDAERVARRLAVETGSLGIREHGAGHRWVADREMRTVTVDVGDESFDVGVKVARERDGPVFDVSTEYDDAAAVARETDRPVREVIRLAESAVDLGED